MRAALISIVGQPHEPKSGAAVGLAGKSLARRQLDFALAAGAEQIVLLGDGTAPDTVALRQAAESAGAKVLPVENAHGLLGAVRAVDHLLVLAPGVLPEAPIVLEMLGKGSSLLILPAGQGVAAGFERIDVDRAWAGALVVQGGLVERLAELPPDSDPAPALLRIALQAKVAERRLPEAPLADGSWSMIGVNGQAEAAEIAWLKRNLPEAPRNRPSVWLASEALRPWAAPVLGESRALTALTAAMALLLGGGVALSAAGWAGAGLTLVALGVMASTFSGAVSRLSEAPFGRNKRSRLLSLGSEILVDVALTVCAVLAIEQDWLHRLFPPLVLVGLLRTLKPQTWPDWSALAGDRLILALVLALAAASGFAEQAAMALALLLIVLNAVQSLERRG